MGLIVAEGFDAIGTAGEGLLNKNYLWSGATISSAGTYVARSSGRYHGYAVSRTTTIGTGIQIDLPSPLSEIYLGMAVKKTGGDTTFLALRDGSSTQIDLRASGTDLQVTRNGTLLGTVASYLLTDIWRWISLRVVIHDTTGIVEVRNGDGTVLLNLTGVDTKNTATAQATNVYLNNVLLLIDHFFLMDTSGATFNGHLTERAIWTGFPNAEGSTLDWTPTGAATRWEAVDDVGPDADSTYISSGTVGHVNLSNVQDPPATITGIVGVMLQNRSRKDAVGTRSINGLIRTGASNFEGEETALDSDYLSRADLFEQNPDTALAWQLSDIDALQIGVEVTA